MNFGPSKDVVDNMKLLYKAAKVASLMQKIYCPGCGQVFNKTVYNKVFCSNQRTEKQLSVSCKDYFWNTVNPERVKALGSRR